MENQLVEIMEQILSDKIQRFIQALGSWSEKSSKKMVFYYGCWDLPGQAGDVVEALAPVEWLNNARHFADNVAKELGLLLGKKKEKKGLKLLVLDPEFSTGERGCLRINIYSKISFSSRLTYRYNQIELKKTPKPGIDFNVATTHWQLLLALFTSMRNQYIDKYTWNIIDMAITSNNHESTRKFLIDNLGTVGGQLVSAVLSSDNEAVESELSRLSNVLKISRGNAPPIDKKPVSMIGKFPVLSPFYRPRFVTISGPDGVGKTTLVNEMSSLLKIWGIPSCAFHYREINKPYNRPPEPETGQRTKTTGKWEQSIIFRIIKRVIPSKLKLAIHWLINIAKRKIYHIKREYGYLSAITRELYNARLRSEFIILDRYWYDRIVQIQTIPEFRDHSLFAARIMCFLAKEPRVAILLHDVPENIHKRKNEVSIDNIMIYQNKLEKAVKRYTNRSFILEIGGRNPKSLSIDVLRNILREIGSHLIDVFEDYHQYQGNRWGDNGIPVERRVS